MKKIWILFASLALVTSLSFGQQESLSKDGLSPASGLSSLDLYKDLNFSTGLSLSPVLYPTGLQTYRSSGFANLGMPARPKAMGGDDNSVFPQGCALANLGIGVGDLFWGGAYGSVLGVAPTLDIDVAITKKLGIGNIGVGGTVAYTSTKFSGNGQTFKYDAVLVGLRGTYHFMFDIDALKDKFDPYAGFLLGYIITNNPSGLFDNNYNLGTKGSAFQPGIFAGAHYYFVQHFGVFAELGYNGFSIFTFGITVKTK